MSFCGGSWYEVVGNTIWIVGLGFPSTDFLDGRRPLQNEGTNDQSFSIHIGRLRRK